MGSSDDEADVRRSAGWLPGGQDALEQWIEGHRDHVDAAAEQDRWHPAVRELHDLIDGDPVLRLYADQMVAQVPQGKAYQQRHLTDLQQLLGLMNALLTRAPEYSTDSMVMTPMAAILDWTMGTPAGFAFYRDPRVNAALRRVLDAWGEFLSGPDSRYVLDDSEHGWLGPQAARAVGLDQYRYEPDAAHGGFTSWNDFFTRRFNDGARPVAAPDDDAVIVSACESTPYGISTDVQRRDRFWIKSQPYSLHDMLAGDPSVDHFVGGTVYQAFLSALDYHRWHSPVAGTVVRAFVVAGTYFAEADSEGDDAVQPTNSQSFQAHTATRAVVLIQADNPRIGLMAFVAVGMVDVSTCLIGDDVEAGHHVGKGDELGRFQYGGSTHCLVFARDVVADFALQAIPQPHESEPTLVHVRSQIATARS